jgi:hypothetical protein
MARYNRTVGRMKVWTEIMQSLPAEDYKYFSLYTNAIVFTQYTEFDLNSK